MFKKKSFEFNPRLAKRPRQKIAKKEQKLKGARTGAPCGKSLEGFFKGSQKSYLWLAIMRDDPGIHLSMPYPCIAYRVQSTVLLTRPPKGSVGSGVFILGYSSCGVEGECGWNGWGPGGISPIRDL